MKTLPRPLEVGDVLVRRRGRFRYRYVVEGFSPYGKVVLRNPSGGTTTAWWETSVPPQYDLVEPCAACAGSGLVCVDNGAAA